MNGSLSPFYLSYFWVMELSSPFLKILPYEVARGWVEGLVGGASKPSPYFAGWDRLGKGGD